MRLCIPTKGTNGLDETVYGHFGSAPFFILVDSDDLTATCIVNADQHHEHGHCNPVAALSGNNIDVVIVGGIGSGAVIRLKENGISVYKTCALTVREAIEDYRTGKVEQLTVSGTCSDNEHHHTGFNHLHGL